MALTLDGRYNTRQLQIVVINSLLMVVSIITVALRFSARKLQSSQLLAEDWFILSALCFSLIVNALLFQSLHSGIGLDQTQLEPQDVQLYILDFYIVQIAWNTAIPIVKLSVLCFLKRMFPVQSMRTICHTIMFWLLAWYIAFQTATIFQCLPVHRVWKRDPKEGSCIDFVPFIMTLAATNFVLDVVMFLLPIRQLWKLHISIPQKLKLSITFGLGIFVFPVSIARLNCLSNINHGNTVRTYSYVPLWTMIELSLAIIVACLPNLMPVLNELRAKRERNSQIRDSDAAKIFAANQNGLGCAAVSSSSLAPTQTAEQPTEDSCSVFTDHRCSQITASRPNSEFIKTAEICVHLEPVNLNLEKIDLGTAYTQAAEKGSLDAANNV